MSFLIKKTPLIWGSCRRYKIHYSIIASVVFALDVSHSIYLFSKEVISLLENIGLAISGKILWKHIIKQWTHDYFLRTLYFINYFLMLKITRFMTCVPRKEFERSEPLKRASPPVSVRAPEPSTISSMSIC